MKNYLLILLMFVFLSSCNAQEKKDKQLSIIYSKQIENLISFFDENAYDSIQKTYYSEIDNKGKVTSKKIYNVALSRMVYGLSYTSEFYPENIKKAKNAINFQLNNLIANDSIGMYFISNVENGIKSNSNEIDIWQQAYGLCGLIEYYGNKPNDQLLKKIHQLNAAFVKRFKDTINGGFYGNYSFLKGQISGSKSLQSLMYPVTSYMANLWEVDSENRIKYETILKENLQLLYQKAWNKKTGWVNVKFTDTWNVCDNSDENNPCFTVTPGHNFQLASLFLRTRDWSFLPEKDKVNYQLLGQEIIKNTISNLKTIENGFYSEYNPITNKVIDQRKTWWQHAEAIIALSLAEGNYKKELIELEEFYFENFQDFEYGGEYFYLTNKNTSIKTELKGSIGKSIYHTIEMIRYQTKNQQINEN